MTLTALLTQPLLLIGVAVLLLGPLLYQLVQRRPGWMALTDSFVFVVIGGLVLFHVLPELIAAAGWPVLPLTLLGLIGPTLIERLFENAARRAHSLTLFLGVAGLCLHEFTDGAALISGDGELHLLLALSIILHRVPVSLTVWWLLRPAYGRPLASLVLLAMMAATLAGGLLGGEVLAHLDSQPLALFQAFVIGSILHVVFHRPHLGEAVAEARRMEGAGSLLGVLAVVLILLPHWIGQGHSHQHGAAQLAVVASPHQDAHLAEQDADHLELHVHADDPHVDEQPLVTPVVADSALAAVHRFIDLAARVAPALLLAYLLAALINYWFPTRLLMRSRSGSALAEALRGALLGLPLPVCVPAVAKLQPLLARAGASAPFTLAFMVASPILGFDAVLVSLALLGWQLTLARLLLAVLLVVAVGYLVSRLVSHKPGLVLPLAEPSRGERLSAALREGYAHLIDHTAPWVLFGLVMAATLAPTPGWQLLAAAPLWIYALVLLLALPLHWCATGVTPIVAVLVLAGLPLSAALAFLLLGPAINLGLLQFIRRQYGLAVAASLLALVVVVAIGGGLLWPLPLALALDLSQPLASWQYLAAALLALIIAISLFRQGARAFSGELLSSLRPLASTHIHGPHCGHAHHGHRHRH